MLLSGEVSRVFVMTVYTLCVCSNRAASLQHLNKYNKALDDARKASQLRPNWEKGHFREG